MRIPLFSGFLTIPFCYFTLIHIIVVSSQCPSDQQQSLLLQLKNSLTFEHASSTKLVKWSNGTDYCSWEGVSCKGDCVTQLDLSSESISGGLDNSSALFSLQSIENLNLAYNFFNYDQIPSGFNKLASLSYLNLSNAGFAGQVPIEISQLTRLVVLDLSTLYFLGMPSLKLEHPDLSLLIGNLSEINELHLDGVNISAQGAHWCQAISSSLPKLRVLSLSSCNLTGPFDDSLLKLQSLSVIRIDSNNLSTTVPEFFSNFTNLTSLRLMNSGLYGTFPDKILQVPTLQTLDLIGNPDLQGSLTDFPQNGSLRSLFLARTNFSGFLPESIGNLKMLSRVDLSYCNFTGPIPKSVANLTELVYVDMTGNKFNGSVPLLSMAKNLTDINLSYNELTGQINSTHWKNLINLVNLDFRYNQLDGNIPLSLLSLPLLKRLLLSNNQFSGQLLEFANKSALEFLDLSSNNLEGPLPKSIFKLRALKILSLSSNNFGGSFPLNNVQQFKNLSSLDLSYNSLLIDYDSTNSSYSSYPNITTLKLASGQLRTFPDFLKNQFKLSSLDLSQNQIHGMIPNWIWRLSSLRQLNLSCNSLVTLQGPFLNLTSTLSMLDLHSNQLQGQIPRFPPLATYLDYSRNNFSSSIPDDIGYFLNSTVFLSLSSNKLKGSIPESICDAANLQVLDLSNNSVSGSIPQCLIALSGTARESLVVLNLRKNKLNGTIPDRFSDRCRLETLDFNENQIDGEFPKSLANCTRLEVLNLGNNQIKDTYPCLLKNISTLRVLVLRSNLFYGSINCSNTNGNWARLQIVDIAHNNFSGRIPGRCLSKWQAMVGNKDDEINHLQFQVLQFNGGVYYQDTIAITTKGLEMQLVKILTVFTSIDLSCNNFSGPIPAEAGVLKALRGLNLSSNALTGTIPASLGNLTLLESLDLSKNSLRGSLPAELAALTFLSFLNLSYNQLVGSIPSSNQFSTFNADSFEGNQGLCGPPLKKTCSDTPDTTTNHQHQASGTGFDWQSIYTGLGFGVGAGIVVILLMLWEEGRKWSDDTIDRILLLILPIMGYSYKSRDQWDDDDEEEDSDEMSLFFRGAYYNDENESESKEFRGPFCVFCSKLDMSMMSAIHNPNCICLFSPPISSSSSSSSSTSP